MGKPRLYVRAKTKERILRLRGPVFGTTEDAVVSRLIEVAETMAELLSPLDRTKGGAGKCQETGQS